MPLVAKASRHMWHVFIAQVATTYNTLNFFNTGTLRFNFRLPCRALQYNTWFGLRFLLFFILQ